MENIKSILAILNLRNPETRVYKAVLKPVSKMKAIHWRLQPLIKKFPILENFSVYTLRRLHYGLSTRAKHVKPWLNYFLIPSQSDYLNFPQFHTINELQEYFTDEFSNTLVESEVLLNKVISSAEKKNRRRKSFTKNRVHNAKVFSLDLKLIFGDKEFLSKKIDTWK